MAKTKKMIVVFGGAGFIGRALCKKILKVGEHELVIVDDRSTSLSDALPAELSVRNYQYNVASPWCMNKLDEILEGADIEYVYNLATINQELAETDPTDAALTNVTGAKLITDFAIKRKAQLIYVSSVSVYGNIGGSLDEQTPVNPLTVYAATKLAGEFISKRAPIWFIYRLSNVYGPGMLLNSPWCGVVGKMLMAAESGKPIVVTQRLGTTRDYTYIDDVVSALYPLCGNSCRVNNVGTGVATTLEDLVELIRAGRPLSINFALSRAVDTVAGRLINSRALWGAYRPWRARVDLKDGIERTRRWILSSPYLPLIQRIDALSAEAHT